MRPYFHEPLLVLFLQSDSISVSSECLGEEVMEVASGRSPATNGYLQERCLDWRLIAVGSLFLFLGLLVYILFRPAGTAVLLPDRFVLNLGLEWLGSYSGALPTLFHSAGFAAIASALATPNLRATTFICASWALINGVIEFGQKPVIAHWLAQHLSQHFSFISNYFVRGHFDGLDVVAGAAGALVAWILVWFIRRA